MSREKWSLVQEKRAKILFERYPKLEEAYNLINSLRAVFRNKKLTRKTAKEKLEEWYEKVAACSLREIKSVRDTIATQNLFYSLACQFWMIILLAQMA